MLDLLISFLKSKFKNIKNVCYWFFIKNQKM